MKELLKQHLEPVLEQFGLDISAVFGLVSYAIIVGACVVKFPQILKIVMSGSAKGLNLSSVYLETVGTVAGTVYNVTIGNPFRTYGETALICVQNCVIVLLCWQMAGSDLTSSHKVTAAVVFVALAVAMVNVEALEPVWPLGHVASPLDGLYAFMTVLYLAARLPQIAQNFSQGHTGVLSLLTIVMNVGGNIARIATSINDGLAQVVVYSFVLNTVLNSTLLLQLLMYWGATKRAMAAEAAKKAD